MVWIGKLFSRTSDLKKTVISLKDFLGEPGNEMTGAESDIDVDVGVNKKTLKNNLNGCIDRQRSNHVCAFVYITTRGGTRTFPFFFEYPLRKGCMIFL